jgi:hypothetical protein
MSNKKVQLYISDADVKLSQFFDQIEAEEPNTKGYLGNKIKDILRAWSGLAELYGEKDVLLLSLRLAAGLHGKSTVESPSTAGEGGTSGEIERGTSPHKEQLKGIAINRKARG